MILAVGGVLVQETKLMQIIPHIDKQMKNISLNKISQNLIFWSLTTTTYCLAFALRVKATAPARPASVTMWRYLLVVNLGLAATCLGNVTDPSVQLLTLPVKRIMPTRAETQREREKQGSFLSFDFAVKKVLCYMASELKWAKIERAGKI